MKKLITEIRTLEARAAALNKKVQASKSVEEINAMQPEIDEICQDLAFKRNKLYGNSENDDTHGLIPGMTPPKGFNQEQRGASPLGKLTLLGTYGIGSNNHNQRSEDNMRFANETEEMRASSEYKEAFYAFAQGRDTTPEQRALITSTTGAAVIPTSTFGEVIQNIQKSVGLLSLVRVLDIPGKLSVPQSDVSTPATWHTEGEEIGESNTPPSNTALSGYELAKLFSMSAATQAMSIQAFENYLVQELTRCNRDALADVLFIGSGTGQPLGILNAYSWDATNSVTVSYEDAWLSLSGAMALLPSNFRQNAVWVMNSVMFYSFVVCQEDANGNPIFSKDLATGMPLSLMGKPVILDDFCPDNTIIFGDPKYYFLNFSQPMAIERNDSAGFTKATVMYRSLAVVDGKPVAPAFVKITKPAE